MPFSTTLPYGPSPGTCPADRNAITQNEVTAVSLPRLEPREVAANRVAHAHRFPAEIVLEPAIDGFVVRFPARRLGSRSQRRCAETNGNRNEQTHGLSRMEEYRTHIEFTNSPVPG